MRILISIIVLLTMNSSFAATRYVALDNPGASPPFSTWATAGAEIQSVLDVSRAGDLILVSNGVYLLENTVQITNSVTLRSVNGPELTTLDGQGTKRCVYTSVPSILEGFTVRNGLVGLDEFGGGLYAEGSRIDASNCVFTGNRAGWGGGAFVKWAGTIQKCMFYGNYADMDGGGAMAGANAVFEKCTVYSNAAGRNGGGFSYNFDAELRNSIVYWNVASNQGGGVFDDYGTCHIFHSTIADNHADNAGGVFGSREVIGSIINLNTAIGGSPNMGERVDGASQVRFSCVSPARTGEGNISEDPLFVYAAPGDYRLQPSSPAVDQGPDLLYRGVFDDYNGLPRPSDGNGDTIPASDMGAHEFWPSNTCGYSISRTNDTIGAQGGDIPVAVAAVPGCLWKVGGHAQWFVVVDTNVHVGGGVLIVQIAPNPSALGRTGTCVIAGIAHVVSQAGAPPPLFDAGGDGVNDFVTFTQQTREWRVSDSGDGSLDSDQFGTRSSVPVPGRYDFDEKMDYGVYDTRTRRWFVERSIDGSLQVESWGVPGALPVGGDFNGDSIGDFAFYDRPSGTWNIKINDGGVTAPESRNWGWSESIPAPADYDGDGIVDLAVYHPAGGNWYILFSKTEEVRIQNWGWSECVPVPADYDGDVRADIAVYHPATGNWYILHSFDGSVRIQNWGSPAFVPSPADYNGDGFADLAAYHPAYKAWFVLGSQSGPFVRLMAGSSAARPVEDQYYLNKAFIRLP